MYACSLGNVMTVKTLFKYHTVGDIHLDFSVRNNEDATALEYALSSHHSQIVAMFAAVKYPKYTEPLEIEKYQSQVKDADKTVKSLYVEPELLRSRKTPSIENIASEQQTTPKPEERVKTGRRRKKHPIKTEIPKITISKAASDDDYLSEDLDVEDFGSLVKAMKECAVEMKQLRSNIENKTHTTDGSHDKGKGSRRHKMHKHNSSVETTTVTVSTTKSKTKHTSQVNITNRKKGGLKIDSESGDSRQRENSERVSKSSSYTKSVHFNSYTSLKSSDESKEMLIHCSNNAELTDVSEPLLSVSNISGLTPRSLCQVTPSASYSRTDDVTHADDKKKIRGHKRNRGRDAVTTPCASSLSERSGVVITPSQVTLRTSPQSGLSLEGTSHSGCSIEENKTVSSIFKDPWNFSSESLPKLPKFGHSKSPVHLPPLRETLRGSMKGPQQRATTLKNIDKELWKLLESSSNSKMKD